MRLLLDECAGDRRLHDALIEAGHDVVRSVDVLGGGADDSTVFAFACHDRRVLMTFNNIDFIEMQKRLEHPGLLLVYRDRRQKDLSLTKIVKAVGNIESVETSGTKGRTIVLNHYCW